MAKQAHSPASDRKTPTSTRASAARGNPVTGSTRRPTQRRGSVTKPVKKTPWGAIITAALVVVGVVVIVVVAINQNRAGATTAASAPTASTVAVGAQIPDFSVKSQDGKTLTRADLMGKPTLLVFFASWCPHCQAEAPRIKQIAQANPDLNVVMIGVGDRETQQDIWGFQSKFGLPFPTYADPTTPLGKTASSFGVTGYPTIFALDKNAIVQARNQNSDGSVGGEVTPEQLQQMVTKAKG